jgi:hypothetical protein
MLLGSGGRISSAVIKPPTSTTRAGFGGVSWESKYSYKPHSTCAPLAPVTKNVSLPDTAVTYLGLDNKRALGV